MPITPLAVRRAAATGALFATFGLTPAATLAHGKSSHGQTHHSQSHGHSHNHSRANRRKVAQIRTRRHAVSYQPTVVQNVPAQPGEIRAMWIVRDSLTSPEKIRNAVAMAKKYHFNTIFVQVRGRGDAFYSSSFEPRAEELAGQPPDFDPLAVALEEGHKAGLEVHAWLDTFLVWHKPRFPYASQHVLNQHPEWRVRNRAGYATITECKDCEGAFLDPGIPEVREYTKQVFLDVVSRYPVDGIHFDYVRFPNEDWSFSDADLTAFRAWALPQVSPEGARYADQRLAGGSRQAWFYLFRDEWRQWRREVVTQTVREISTEAHKIRPGIIVSAAVFPNYRVASQDKGQDWHTWLREGILDAACPMTYNLHTEMVGAQVRDALAHSSGRPIVAGVGAWQMPAGSAVAKGQLFRALGVAGINFFSYDGMTRDGRTEAYLAKVGGSLFASPATAPNWHRTVDVAAAPVLKKSNLDSSDSAEARHGGQ